MTRQVLVAGGGIGGMAAALACARAGWEVRLFERAEAFAEVGAGIQIGPNVTRILQAWGLGDALARVAAFPFALQVRDAASGDALARLPLGARALARYGAPYATVHRADLHDLLLAAVRADSRVHVNGGQAVQGFTQGPNEVTLQRASGPAVEGDLLIGADGLWSRVREQCLADGPPRATGHLAYRALLSQTELPAALRSQDVTAWLGPGLHVVHYPVRAGTALNIVAIVHGELGSGLDHWDHAATAEGLRTAMAPVCAALRALLEAVPDWRLWALCDRPPVRSPEQMAQGRVALLGDAAHPMRPYLAQGAGMAIEDAAELGRNLAMPALEPALALRRYALNRWQRNARTQARALRNGRIFHATGFVRWGRNLSLRLWGDTLLDVPWLYRGPDTLANV